MFIRRSRIISATACTLLALGMTAACGEGGEDPPATDGTGGVTATGGGTSTGSSTSATGGGGNTTSTGGAAGAATGGGSGTEIGFDSSLEGLTNSYTEGFGAGQGGASAVGDLIHDDAEGGVAKATIPFSADLQGYYVSLNFDEPLDLSAAGTVITARVKLVSGLTSDVDHPGGATLFAKSGDEFDWGAGTWTNIDVESSWIELTFALSAAEAPFNAADVREIGIKFATGEGGSDYSDAVILIDYIKY